MTDRLDPSASENYARFQSALRQLLDAHDYASQAGKDPWQFAVEVESMRRAGLSNSDLRWLVCEGYVLHGLEETRRRDKVRLFKTAPNLMLEECSCFVLTPKGLELAQQEVEAADKTSASDGTGDVREETASAAEGPYWDEERRTLYWRGRPVKQFRYDAPQQELVLKCFQSRGWARWIEVALPDDGGGSQRERLNDTIKNLNRNVRPLLRFRHTGNRVSWEPGKEPLGDP